MEKQFEAIFDNGVFRPRVPVELPQNQLVIITVPDSVPEMAVHTGEPVPANETPEAENEEAPWRGVFVPPRQRQENHLEEYTVEQASLTKRAVRVNLNWHRTVADDE